MPGMRGGGMMPGSGGGGGMGGMGGGMNFDMSGGGQSPFQRFGSMGGLDRSQSELQQAMESLWRMEEQCARGSGSACISAQTMRQRIAAMQQKHQGQLQFAQQRTGGAGSMGVGRGGGGRGPGASQAAAMLGAMYGMGGGGGFGGGW